MAADTIPNHYTEKFETGWIHLAQQKRHRLEGTYVPVSFTGERKSFNRMDSQEAQDITTRKGDTPVSNPATDKRWINMAGKELGNDLDQFDAHLLGEITLPTSEYTQGHAWAFNRAKDRTLLAALTGNAVTGKDGTILVPLPSSQRIDAAFEASGDVGLTLNKLLEVRQKLADADVDIDGADGEEEGIYGIITERQIGDLLKDVKMTSRDYVGDVMALKSGKIDSFLGVKFKRVQGGMLTKAGDGVRDCIFYTKSSVRFADGMKRTTIDRIPDKQNKILIYSVALMGAVRMFEERVVIVECDETPA